MYGNVQTARGSVRNVMASTASDEIQTMRWSFLHPSHWPTWVGLGVLRLVECLPYAAQRHLAAAMGVLIRRLCPSFVGVARRNLEACLPHLGCGERERLLTEHCRSLAMGLCETAMTWWGSRRRVQRLAHVQGLAHLDAARAGGRGAILIGGHFTTTDLATRILASIAPLNIVFREVENPLLSQTMHDGLSRYCRLIARDDIGSMVHALQRNEVLWWASDHCHRGNGAVMATFFDLPAATTTATSGLARLSGARVLTCFPERLRGTAGYRVTIAPGLDDLPGTDPRRDAERFNRLLEKHIRKVPEQYSWMQRQLHAPGAVIADR